MPFTLAHPAAVLPLRWAVRRDRLPLDAFVVGAMTPDFEYLWRLEPLSLVSHSLRGLLVFCLPVGLLTLVLWVGVLREPVRRLFGLASGVESAAPLATWSGRASVAWWGRASVALLVGGLTHLAWDAVTHRDAWGPVLLPVLHRTMFTVGTLDVPLYNVLQHVSSVAGVVVVGVWLWRALQRDGAWPAVVRTPWRLAVWGALGAAALTVGAWNANGRGYMKHPSRATIVLGRVAVGAMVGFAVALVVYAVVYAVVRRVRAAPSYDTSRD